MRRYVIAFATLFSLVFSTTSFAQGGFATVTGTVTDSSGALIPGVNIKATATDTGVITTTLSNETGAYNFPSLLPGRYTITASLTGLATQNITDAILGASQSYRYNFKMGVATSTQTVDVTVSAQTMLAQSGATIGQALSEQKVHDLPLVGNNVLGLLGTLSGVENIQNGAFGREGTTLAGVSAQNIPVVRDGVIVSDTRFPTGINAATVMNPDLIGEVRLILAPVDAELGRGNGTIQITTRSGSNRFTGSAVWTARNSAFNPNSWTNNSNRTLPAGTPQFQPDGSPTPPQALPVNWSNTHQGTASFGGPIVKNKTFFFVLFDMNQALQRSLTNFQVLTPCARIGIFRYFDGWNNGNALTNTTSTGATPTTASVNLDGTPRTNLLFRPDGVTPTSLQTRSVFGPLSSVPTTSDCSGAAINSSTLVPTGATSGWDANRVAYDTTGFIRRNQAYVPLPNNYELGDGLNTAGFRWLRRNTGLDNLFSVGEDTGIRKQINVKIDQNFNANNKLNVNVSYERVHSDDVYMGYPGSFSNENFHRPIVVTSAFTSTLSASLLNEARVGYKATGTNVIAPWKRDIYQDEINAYLPAPVNDIRILARSNVLDTCSPITGARPPGGCPSNQAFTAYATDKTPSWTFGDTLSWTTGKHALKFGGELRWNDSTSYLNGYPFFSPFSAEAQATGGSAPGAPQNSTASNGINPNNPAFTAIGTNTAGLGRNLLDYLSGSLSAITEQFWLTTPQSTTWSDYRNETVVTTPLHQTEFSAFAKDDFKVTKNLTLNLGVRWEYYGVPYNTRGITVSPVGGGAAAFGISGRSFDNYWNAPAVGSNGTATAASYDPALMTAVHFVGPNSPNPELSLWPKEYNNFGPSLGFSWQLPWFGEGKTTMRGGYQVTYQGGGRFSALEAVISYPPGSTNNATYADPTNLYLDMTDLNPSVIPVTPTNTPLGTLRVTDRTQAMSVIDPDYKSPYVQNLTLSLSRQISQKLQVSATYIGTLAVKQFSTFSQFNSPNFLYNGLASQFSSIRTGGEAPLLDQMFAGINLCPPSANCTVTPGQGPFAAIGSVNSSGVLQTAAMQMRSNTQFATNLAQGNFAGLAGTINTFNYAKTAPGAACTTGSLGNCGLPDLPTGLNAVQGAAMRFSGLFPENFIVNNPQYTTVNYLTNMGHSNYHSLQVEGTWRPIQGITMQGTYTYAKNLGLPGTFTNPVDRHKDYTIVNNSRPHTIRTNAVFELPIGPNKLLLGNSSGALARAVERWQLGVIYNYNTGGYATIGTQAMLYGNATPDVVDTPFTAAAMKALTTGNTDFDTRNTSSTGLEARYFGDQFATVADPQCATVTTLQGLNTVANPRCTLRALAYIVPDGTPGSVPVTDTIAVANNPNYPQNTTNVTRTRSGVIVLRHPQPGTRGTLGQNTMRQIGNYALDTSLSKNFRISESKSLVVRIDTTNVLNHPTPNQPSFNMNSTVTPFGQITAKGGGRAFQGQLRLNF
jgi:hypothetical protein